MKYAVREAGRMGAAVAIARADGGHDVTAWNRTASETERLAERGVRVWRDVVSAVRDADTVVLLLLDQGAALAALGVAPSELRAGR